MVYELRQGRLKEVRILSTLYVSYLDQMISNPKMRQEYLDKHWVKYPTSSSPFRGRLVQWCERACTLETLDKRSKHQIPTHIKLAPGFSPEDCLKIGDIIEIQYSATIKDLVEAIKLLVPCLGDNPFSESDFLITRAKDWNKYLSLIRTFFVKRDFVELRTPTLVNSPGLEPFLDPFKTRFNLGRSEREVYLPTSPEFHLKKSLTLGYEKVFELKECFRNGELSQTHSPEFLMLEWYRAYEKIENIIKDVSQIFEELQSTFFTDRTLEKVKVFKMEDLWAEILTFDLNSNSKIEDLWSLSKSLKIGEGEKDFDDLFNLMVGSL
jgi:lysyl-tRNA synthetase class 2